MTNLFQRGDFTSAAGLLLPWKIDCDALSDEDWATIAWVGAQKLPRFGSVVGVPRGGLKLAAAMEPYATKGPMLIVDDVWTTGKSMREYATGGIEPWHGFVAFARGRLPPHVRAFLTIPG